MILPQNTPVIYSDSNRRNIEDIELSLSEILPAYLIYRLYL